MLVDDFLKKYERALQAQADADVTVKLLEMSVKVKQFDSAKPRKKTPKKKPQKKKAEAKGYDDDEQEFLSVRVRPLPEVAKFMGMPATKVWRLAKRGILISEQPDGPNTTVWISTQSVIDYTSNGKSDSKQKE